MGSLTFPHKYLVLNKFFENIVMGNKSSVVSGTTATIEDLAASCCLSLDNQTYRITDLEKFREIRTMLIKDIKETDEEIMLVNQTVQTHRGSVEKIDMMVANNCDITKKSWIKQQFKKRIILKKLLDDVINEKKRLLDNRLSIKMKLVDVSQKISIIENTTCQ